MIHHMKLYGEYFKSIEEGKKKIEVRLNDEKRRKIKVRDRIKFIKLPGQEESFQVEVTNLKRYDTFKAMYEDIPSQDFGCEGQTTQEMVDGIYDIYTPEQEKKWGTVAITVKILIEEV